MSNAQLYDRIAKCGGLFLATGDEEMALDLRTWAEARGVKVSVKTLEDGVHQSYRAFSDGGWTISLVVEVPRCR